MEKTCGNCHWFCEDSRGIGIGSCLNMNSERMCSGNFFPCAHARNYPCNQYVFGAGTLEQRYQQLAEVARGMITALEVAYIAVDTGREWNSYVIKGYKKRLEELGVEL